MSIKLEEVLEAIKMNCFECAAPAKMCTTPTGCRLFPYSPFSKRKKKFYKRTGKPKPRIYKRPVKGLVIDLTVKQSKWLESYLVNVKTMTPGIAARTAAFLAYNRKTKKDAWGQGYWCLRKLKEEIEARQNEQS